MDANAVEILGIEIRAIRIPLRRSYRTAGTTIETRDLILLRLIGDRFAGWGEASPVPGYSRETANGIWDELTKAAAGLVGTRHPSPAAAGAAVASPLARHALEMAAWDLAARCRQVPVIQLLGGDPGPVAVGAVAGLDATAGMLETLEADGYERVKLKVAGLDDLARVERLVADVRPGLPIAADANGSLDPADTARIGLLADRIGLEFLEQPFATTAVAESAALAAAMDTPICLDETITGKEAAGVALKAKAARLVALKPARLGGIAASLEVAATAKAHGASVWIGGMLESSIGRAASLALARVVAPGPAADLSPPDSYLELDPVVAPLSLGPNGMEVPDLPGLGVDVDNAVLDAITRQRAGFGAF